MIFVCPACGSKQTLPTLSWEAMDEPIISLVECHGCSASWTPERPPRPAAPAADKKPRDYSRKDEKRLSRRLHGEDPS